MQFERITFRPFIFSSFKGENSFLQPKKPVEQLGSEGGLLILPPSTIKSYLQELLSTTTQNFQISPGVMKLQQIIYSDPALKSDWENGISISNNLKGLNGRQVLEIVNAVLNLPPAFNKSEFIGFPINAVFLDFMQTENGRSFFTNEKINHAIKDILNQYAQMVQSPKSALHLHDQEPRGWFCESAHKLVDYHQFAQYNPTAKNFGFDNWNSWFLRTFKPKMRPIGAQTPDQIDQRNVIVNSCESTPLSYPCQPVENVKKSDSFWLKDNKYSLSGMFSSHGSQKGYPDLFAQGTIYQAYLSPWNYHHWHAPVDGQIIDIYSISGTYYLTQSQYLGHYDALAPNESQVFLTASAARMIFLIKADNPKIGHIAIIYIGMTQISSCITKRAIGEKIKKGEHIGHFAYGGSSHAVVFQKQAQLTFNKELYQFKDGQKQGRNQKLNTYLAHVN